MNQLNEGIWDRAKAQVAGVTGAAKGLGDRAVGSAVQGYGALTKNTAAKQAGQNLVQRGKSSGEIAKIESYRNTAKQKIQKLSEEIFSDLKKLGIDLKGLNPNIANSFVGSLNKGFDSLIGSLNSVSPASPGTSKPSVSSAPSASAPATSVVSPTATPPISTPASAPMKVAPRGERAALDSLTKEKDSMLNDPNSLIGIAKYVAGTSGIGSGKPKDGVALLNNASVLNDPSKVKPEDKAKIDASLKQLATKLKVDQKRLVGLLGKVFTESITKSFKNYFLEAKSSNSSISSSVN